MKPISPEYGGVDCHGGSSAERPAVAGQQPPTEADRQPNNLIQSDHPLVAQMADEAAGQRDRPLADRAWPWNATFANSVRNKNFTQALATAADVAQTREGDCTEHAVLLAALARAKDIPARVAIGLVYVESLKGFGYHMWTELYVNDAWLPFGRHAGPREASAGAPQAGSQQSIGRRLRSPPSSPSPKCWGG